MGTANFYNKNASRIYAVEIEEEYDLDYLIENVQNALEWATLKSEGYADLRGYLPGREEGREIAEITTDRTWYDNEVVITVKAIVRYGYYAGVNLDWEVEIDVDGETMDPETMDRWDVYQAFVDNWMSEKRAELYCHHAYNWINDRIEKITDRVERVFKAHSKPLVVKAQFSNGETLYAEAD